MVVWVNVGETGTGKTQHTKTKIIPLYRRGIVYDVQNEYSELPNIDDHGSNEWVRIFPHQMSPKEYVSLMNKFKNTMFVTEEATTIFDEKVPNELESAFVKKRHSGNRFLFNFHSIQDITPKIYRYTDWLTLFKTADFEKDVINKLRNKDYVELWNKLQTAPRFSKYIIQRSNLAKGNII